MWRKRHMNLFESYHFIKCSILSQQTDAASKCPTYITHSPDRTQASPHSIPFHAHCDTHIARASRNHSVYMCYAHSTDPQAHIEFSVVLGQRMQRCPSLCMPFSAALVLFYIAAETAGGFYTHSSTHSCRYKCALKCISFHLIPPHCTMHTHTPAKRIRNIEIYG